MINAGENNISVYAGDSEVSVYIGDELIYPLNFGELTAITMTNLTWVTDISWEGGTGTSANCSYVITGYYDSGKTRRLNSKTTVEGSITADSTTSETRDLVGTLELTFTCSGFTVTGSVDAYQEAYAPDYSKKYLTMKVLTGGTIEWVHGTGTTAMNIQYSKDNGANWTTIASTTAGTSISVDAGDKVMFRGNNSRYSIYYETTTRYRNGFQITGCTVEVEGNIMSMIGGDNFSAATLTEYAFCNFFYKCTGIVTAENLILPTATKANCYVDMFYSATSLTTAPVLSASSLSLACYYEMFRNCISLNYVKCLATSGINSGYSTNYWLTGVAASGIFVKAAGVSWPTGDNGIPSGWTVQEV